MKLDKLTTRQVIALQNNIHQIISRLEIIEKHRKAYESGAENDSETSVILRLYCASAELEMIIERIEE